MRGRKPVPTGLKLLTGNPGHRPLPPEPKVAEATDAELLPPEDLQGEGRAEWEALAVPLKRAGVLKSSDLGTFETYCRLHGEVHELEQAQDKHGIEPSIKLAIVNALFKLRKQKKEYAVELGLTPSARARVKAEPVAEQGDTTEEMLFGKKGA